MKLIYLLWIGFLFILCCCLMNTDCSTNTTLSPEDSEDQHEKRFIRKKVVVSTVLEPPYMMLKKHGAFLAGNDRFEGFLADILQRLATSIGFDYEIRLTRDGKYGELRSSGEWDGMLGDVERGEATMAAGALIITEDRQKIVDFSEPFLSLRSSAILRKPVDDSTPRITNAADLLSSDYTYGLVEKSVTQQLLTDTKDNSLYRTMWTRITTFWPSALVSSLQAGVDRARRENYAFILDSAMAEFVASRQPCDLYTTEPFLDIIRYAFVVRKDALSLRHAIDRVLRSMKTTDEMQYMYLKWWKDECTRDIPVVEKITTTTRSWWPATQRVHVRHPNHSSFNSSCLFIWSLLAILSSLVIMGR